MTRRNLPFESIPKSRWSGFAIQPNENNKEIQNIRHYGRNAWIARNYSTTSFWVLVPRGVVRETK